MPCKEGAPQLVAQYKEQVAKHPSVEMIHVSLDFNKAKAEAWAAEEQFPWPTIAMDKIEQAGIKDLTPQEAPSYKLVDLTGKVVAQGKEAAFAKIAELGKK